MRHALAWLILVLVGAVGGGSGDPAAEDGGATDVRFDVDSGALLDTPSADALGDAALDGAVGETAADDVWVLEDVTAGGLGAACAADDDCDVGLLCVDIAGEGVCTQTCVTECPEGWSCKTAVDVGGGLLSVCLPPGDLLCRPCSEDARCLGGYCQTFDDGRRCTRPCDTARPCPSGYECVRTTSDEDPNRVADQCVPQTGTCDCGPKNAGEERLCMRSNANGTCLGRETCDRELGWLACSASEPAAETCNGVDDDCDGIADDGVDPPGSDCVETNEHGTCVGAWVCTGADDWLCTAVEPAAEACNFQDDDCDGATDEDFRDATSGAYSTVENCGVCGNDCRGRFPNAVATCDATGAEPACVVAECVAGYRLVGPFTCVPIASNLCAPCTVDAGCAGGEDLCLDLDDGRFCGRDCADGNVYGEGCPDGFVCVAVTAEARQCLPTTGACTCREAEHDGATRPCFRANQHGTCTGLQTCAAADGWSTCSAPLPTAEVCNGADDDCDGTFDDGVLLPDVPCVSTNPIGTCGGRWECTEVDGVTDWRCEAPAPAVETCNDRDDDCDGATDEDFRAGPTGPYAAVAHCGACGRSCLTAVPFVTEAACEVAAGVPTCRVVACAPGTFKPPDLDLCVPYGPAYDCSPCSADSNCAGLPGVCVPGEGGSFCAADCALDADCAEGFACVGVSTGTRQCVPTTGSCTCYRPEHDGQIRPCFRENEVGTCTGLQTCAAEAGWSACTAGEAMPEVCDGRDDDCDGLVDEDLEPPEPACEDSNEYGTCTGALRCDERDGVVDWHCDALTPAAEVCNAYDDDCDGATDEDFRSVEDGLYDALEHCGGCDRSCVGFVPFAAETGCAPVAGEPTCVVVDCADGYFQPAGFELCVPLASASDCTPCTDDDRCALLPGACVALDDGSFCARDCGGIEDCSPGFLCEDGHCVPPSRSCNCLPGADAVVRTCVQANEFGVCVGQESCDPLLGWTDCSAVMPTQERCDGADNDCDGEIDEPGSLDCTPYYRDGDDDGWGDPTDVLCLCAPGLGHETLRGGDCDDDAPGVNPDATETCNGVDDDCSGGADEDGTDGCLLRYRDGDRDGFGVETRARCLCAVAAPWDAVVGGDCDDEAPSLHPDAVEACNGVDDDCDDVVDEEDATGCLPYYADVDGDGHGDPDAGACLCGPDLAHPRSTARDCDDDDPAAHPGGTEACGGGDEDCDGVTDEADAVGCADWWVDEDEDGFGVPYSVRCLCAPEPPFRALAGGDCDDDDPAWTPYAVEACATDGDCCRTTDVCRAGRCLAPPATGCATHGDCRGDTYCSGAGECLPFGLLPMGGDDPTCAELRLPDTIVPARQCRWAGPEGDDPWSDNTQVLGQPIVVDLDLDGDPATVRPSIVFVAYGGTDDDTTPSPGDGPGADPAKFGVLRVIDGGTCAPQAVTGAERLVGAGTPAAADLDGDGRPEILAHRAGGGVVAYRWDPVAGDLAVAWVGRDRAGAVSTVGAGTLRWSGPTVTDLDGDGRPEVLVGATVFGADGALRIDNLGFKPYGRGHLPVVSDVDRDGTPELVTGDGVWRYTVAAGQATWQRASYSTSRADGYVAIANFGSYAVSGLPTASIPEIAVVSTGQLRIQRLNGTTVFGPYDLPYHPPVSSNGDGGLPTIADFDGDGAPEVGVFGAGGYTVFDTSCAGTTAPFGCKRPGVLWTLPTRDLSSASSGSTVFDFQDDEIAEVVLADECFVRIVRGTDGHVLWSHARSSGSFLDGPIVADCDGDGRAEIVVVENVATAWLSCPSTDPVFEGLQCARNSDCPGGPCLLGRCRCEDDTDCGGTGEYVCGAPAPNTPGTDPVCLAASAPRDYGLTVWRDRDDRWAGTRPIWNQSAYFVTNIGDDGVVPAHGESAAPWLPPEANAFRANRQDAVAPTKLPDLSVRAGVPGNCDADGRLALPAEVCNRGAGATGGPVQVAFYRGDPQAGRVLCTPSTDDPLPNGACAPVVCEFAPDPGGAPVTVTVVADFTLTFDECREDNSTATFAALTCRNLP